MDTPDIHRFPTEYMVKKQFLLESLWILESSSGVLEKIQCRLALPTIKYNCAVLFLKQMNWLFMYIVCFQIYIIIDAHCKTSIRNLWNPCKCQIHLMFLQGIFRNIYIQFRNQTLCKETSMFDVKLITDRGCLKDIYELWKTSLSFQRHSWALKEVHKLPKTFMSLDPVDNITISWTEIQMLIYRPHPPLSRHHQQKFFPTPY